MIQTKEIEHPIEDSLGLQNARNWLARKKKDKKEEQNSPHTNFVQNTQKFRRGTC
jgi:hypothetical protein